MRGKRITFLRILDKPWNTQVTMGSKLLWSLNLKFYVLPMISSYRISSYSCQTCWHNIWRSVFDIVKILRLCCKKKSDLGWISKWAQSQNQETHRTTSLPYYPKCKTSERLWPQCVLYRCCHHCDFYDRYCCFCCRIFYCKFNTFYWKKTRQKDFYHQFKLKNVEFSSCFLDPPIPKCSLIYKNFTGFC